MAVVFLTRVISLSWLQCTCMYIHVHYSTKLQDVYLKVEYRISTCIRDNRVIAALITEGNYHPVHFGSYPNIHKDDTGNIGGYTLGLRFKELTVVCWYSRERPSSCSSRLSKLWTL